MRHDADVLSDEVAQAARRRRARRTLLLDLDGTLAPIAPVPEAARVPRACLRALEGLVSAGWKVAVVSGRPAKQVREMVPVPGVAIFGSHGWEDPLLPRRAASRLMQAKGRLAALAKAAMPLADGVRGARVERKPAGIAFHDRSVPRGEATRWRRRVRAFLDAQDLEGLDVLPGRRVVEIRLRGRDKGDVLRRFVRLPGSDRFDASLVAVGDDRTDEDMFRALWGRGLAVRVGSRRGLTLATRRLASPASVRRFLERLAATGGAAATRRPRPAADSVPPGRKRPADRRRS
jgi:trehalose-phosphatase